MPAALTTLLCPQTVYFASTMSSTRVRVVHLILETLRDGRKIPGPGARAADRGSRLAAGCSSPMYSCRRDGSALKTHCLHLPFSQGGLRAGLPTVLGGRWRRVRVCISANRLLASCSSGEAARLRAWHLRLSPLGTQAWEGDPALWIRYGPAALARRHISTLSNMHTHYLLNLLSFLFVRSCSTSFQ